MTNDTFPHSVVMTPVTMTNHYRKRRAPLPCHNPSQQQIEWPFPYIPTPPHPLPRWSKMIRIHCEHYSDGCNASSIHEGPRRMNSYFCMSAE
ncbi:hypothetical protein CEXT_28551 [Caerostris extrusa]|uniref:Uncharacterized protein n=1 Tax=Caerostris extrusa TaxID=172846 RepID=A0AAV4MUV7_CAEEX|nr:hypothetical protein CEXT_28551 [Caerostris extrusa]